MYKKYAKAALFLFLLGTLWYRIIVSFERENGELAVSSMEGLTKPNAGIIAAFDKNIFDAGIVCADLQIVPVTLEEQTSIVYTFLQGPRAYREGLPWSGDWCEKIVRSNSFGGFGCGLCCMANIYSTMTNYECSPWDMYEYATLASNYYPCRESGAIGWKDMKKTLKSIGFSCELRVKPETYEEFQSQIKEVRSVVVLVNSANDDTFWKNTPGHYVNIWLYQEDTDEVFLAEPGDPEHNRSWIPLRYVYDALKTVSQYQYMTVTSYEEEKNDWKRNQIDAVWNGRKI